MYVDLRALRNDRVSLVERGSPHSLCLLESGKLLPGVKVIIANPDTKGQCGDSHLGEVSTRGSSLLTSYRRLFSSYYLKKQQLLTIFLKLLANFPILK